MALSWGYCSELSGVEKLVTGEPLRGTIWRAFRSVLVTSSDPSLRGDTATASLNVATFETAPVAMSIRAT